MAPFSSPPPTPGDDVPVSALSRGRLVDVLTDTVGDLERLELPLTVEGVEEARRLRSSLIGQVRDHVLPRLADADVPAIVVVGGSTGAGKSTTSLGGGSRRKRNCATAIPASSSVTNRAGINNPPGRYRATVARIGSRKAAAKASGPTHVLAWLGTRQV